MSRFLVIYNPISNKGGAEKIRTQVVQMLSEQDFDFDLILTEYPGHALELSRDAAMNGYDAVVAAGGDGTVNEVINGLMYARQSGGHDIAMGVLPIGRGNDFNYSMGAPDDWQSCCQVLAAGHTHRIDVGLVRGGLYPEGRYFGNGIGIGFDAVVGFFAAEQRITGFAGYLVAAIRTIFAYSPAPIMAIEMENETLTLPALMVNVMNGRRLGGGFMIAPQGDPMDGLMDLCIAHEVKVPRIFGLIGKFLKGEQYGDEAIQARQSARVTIRAEKGTLPVHADGETITTEGDRIEIELLPRQLELYLPENEAV